MDGPLTIAALVLTTFGWMWHTGTQSLGDQAADARLFEVLGAADAYGSMILGGVVATVVAMATTVGTGAVSIAGLPKAAWVGVKPVTHALVILFMAWTLSAAIASTGAGAYLEGVVQGSLDARWLPLVSFLVAALTAFATGSSFSAMGILVPVVVGIAGALTGDAMSPIALACTASILSGACLGDHASPISDTTVLSSIGAGVDLVTHVRTQLPYVLCVGAISALIGYLPAGYGVHPAILLAVGSLACIGVVIAVGRVPEATIAPRESAP